MYGRGEIIMIAIIKFVLLLVILAAVLWLERWLIQKEMIGASTALPFVFLLAYLLLMYFAFTGVLAFHFWFNFATEILMVPTIALVIYYSINGIKPWRQSRKATVIDPACHISQKKLRDNCKGKISWKKTTVPERKRWWRGWKRSRVTP